MVEADVGNDAGNAPQQPEEPSDDSDEKSRDAVEEDEANKVALTAVSDLDYFRAKAGTLESDDEEVEKGSDEEGSENIEEEEEEEEEIRSDSDEGEGSEKSQSEGEGEGDDAKEEGEGNEEAEAEPSKAALRVGEGGEVADEISVSETGRLFVRNLPYSCTEEELTDVFKQYGLLAEVHSV